MLRISSRAEVAEYIGGGWNVLDVGSGDRPFPLATVLVDRLPRTQERVGGIATENPTGTIARQGKPLVVAELEKLPFADQSFDFVYASHVLEHVNNPMQAVSELARVAPRGYIECPRAWFEFVDGSPFHRWLIDLVEGELWCRPKTEHEAHFMASRRLFDLDHRLFYQLYGHIFNFEGSLDPGGTSVEKSFCHICVYWESTIPCRIVPPASYREF